ncbi:NIF family HAD-type phosphatase [Massilia sp. TSP1-1-2]|uniref:NIF family HAD-type phosphatase n=1 Tax=Massilia sp. TSP1-1-2 TaxID=2804649 RepID=UPI003CEC308F
MINPTTLALDLEGTLISNAVSQIPRPELFWFLDSCRGLFERIVIYTAVSEDRFRKIANLLAREQAVPSWFANLEYINWDKITKNLSNIPNAKVAETVLVDDQREYVHSGQDEQWIMVPEFLPPYDINDRALRNIIQQMKHRFTLPQL